MGMTNFTQIMHNWQRMCAYYDKFYQEDSCHFCPIKKCDSIWEMRDVTNWKEYEEIISTWAAEHPEPKYPTWREYLKKIGVVIERNIDYFENGPKELSIVTKHNAPILNENADQPIPAEIATALGLEPHYE